MAKMVTKWHMGSAGSLRDGGDPFAGRDAPLAQEIAVKGIPTMILRTIVHRPDLPFQRWRRDVHSQCGEDGIIEQIMVRARANEWVLR